MENESQNQEATIGLAAYNQTIDSIVGSFTRQLASASAQAAVMSAKLAAAQKELAEFKAAKAAEAVPQKQD